MDLVAHEYYFRPSLQNCSSWRDAYFRFCGALYLRNPVELFARYASRINAVVYRYEFAYMLSSSIYPKYFEGALGDEIILLFPSESTKFKGNDAQIANSMAMSWTNFIKTGNPSTPEKTWDVFNELNKTLIGITKDGLQMSTTTNLDSDVHFWRQVFLPLYKNFVPSTELCLNRQGQVPDLPAKSGFGVFTLSIIIIVVTALLAGAVYLYMIKLRGRGYKWSW